MGPRVRPIVANRGGFDDASWSRRRWLRDTALAISGLATTAWGQASSKSRLAPGPGEQEVIAQVQSRARKARLGEIGTSRKDHFLCLGDSSEGFRKEALGICEALGKDFLTYFRGRGFKVAYPDRRMTVVALKDVGSFGAYIGEDPGDLVGGQYELDSNQLVIFDLRARRANLAVSAERVNTFALVHETIHMLCFNSGLLSREADVPVCISEGLATYGELWLRSRGSKAFGALNKRRLLGEFDAQGDKIPWIPIDKLFSDDDLFRQPKIEQVAYAESWLLVSSLLKGPAAQVEKFQAYLAGLPKLGAGKDRIAYAESRLGSLRALEREVLRFRGRVLRK